MKVMIFACLLPLLAYGETQVYKAEAKVQGKTVYFETHTVIRESGRIIRSTTEYTDPQGNTLGVLTNDYSHSLNAPAFTMEDKVLRNRHGVKYAGEKLLMFNQDEGEKEELKSPDESDLKGKLLVGGQGLHYYLVANLEEVIRKGKLDLKFLIPGRLDAYDFYLKVAKKTETTVEFDIEIDNWLLRLFAPGLKLIYERKTARLLSYSGLSNIRNSEKEMMNVNLHYSYNN